MKRMSLFPAILLLLLAVLLLCLVFTGTVKADWLAWFCGLAAFVLAAAACVMIYNWLLWQSVEVERERAEARAITPEYRLLEQRINYVRIARQFPPELAEALKTCPALWDVIGGTPEAAVALRTAGGPVSYDTVVEWLAGSPDEVLDTMPVRECTNHEQAARLVDHLVTWGYLDRARGNNPARWAYPEARARAIRFISNDTVRLEA